MTLVPLALAASLFVECENFEKLGGWVVETQSMRQLGSSYVMAHGYGKPVADAETKVDFPAEGEYTVWARTRNWNAEWTKGAAGRFKVAVGTEKTPFAWESEELGVGDKAWHWQKAGVVRLKKGTEYVVRLHDLTGFNGRCDALYFTTEGDTPPADAEMDAWRHRQTGIVVKDDPGEYDLVVVGGGMAGCCAALTASRLGVKTLLLQDRDVLGGCNSSEVRVGLGGRMHTKPYPALGEVMKDIQPLVSNNSPLDGKYYEDDRKATAFELKDIRVWQTPGAKPFLKFRQYVYAVEMSSNRMTAVVARDTHTGAETRYRAKLFCDATGDAVLARLAGCETMYGCEARSRFHESCAPEKASRQVMGHSVQWLSKRCETASPFPDIGEWALPIDEQTGRYQRVGSWEQETGFFRDMADDTERIRDYGLLAVFSNWHWIKNRSEKRDEYANDAFSWISPIGGKRESYRVVGDYVLTQNDLENHTETPDATAAITWGIDFHFPDPENAKSFAEPFRAVAYHRGTGSDHPVPYRCLYARDCENLFLAGRDISVSHCAFAAVRVMRTLGMLGEVVGMASAICREEKCLPRDVYAKHLDKLKKRMTSGAPKLPDFHGYEVGMAESYDLNHRGWRQIYPRGKRGELDEKMKEEIRGYGYAHRNEHPDLQSARRRLVLADESRAKVHYYDSFCPTDGFAVAVKKPVWDLKRVGAERYRIVCHGGFQVVDLKERKVVDEFSYPDFKEWMATAVCDLKDGGFVFSVNPSGADRGKAIHFYEFGADRKLRRIMKLAGYFNARSMERGRDGEWLVAHEKGFARIRLPEQGETVELVKNYPQPAGRNLFAVIPARTGGGYLAGCGYGGGLVRFNAEGEAVSQWFVPTDTGKESRFYAQVEERENGNIYLAHWTGHGEDDSFKGWQVVEFDPSGKVVWHLDSPDRFGSISGVIVLEDYSVPAAKMPEEKHVFSMSCKVTACNGDLATAEGRAKAIAWWKKNNITKLWLESYRHGERVASERLVELRDAFRAEGLETCGMITPTMLNDTAPGKKEPQMVVCWSDPKARERMREECARAAKVFDTVILDDFLFSSCGDGCARCRADKAARQIADWGEYKRTLMYEVCERDILPAVKKANPKAHFIIKYPCWYRNYANGGYSPARQAELFGECWVGTETRDANPEPLQACWIAAWMDSITQGRCGGGWYDALDCRPEKFIEQARYTILGGMKESLVHCYDYLLADDPGRTPFGEKAESPRACAEAFERESGNLAALAELVRGAERGKFEMLSCGVSRHEFRKDGKEFTVYLNTTGKTVRGLTMDIALAPHELRIVAPGMCAAEAGK